jgi:hypothetical protein
MKGWISKNKFSLLGELFTGDESIWVLMSLRAPVTGSSSRIRSLASLAIVSIAFAPPL